MSCVPGFRQYASPGCPECGAPVQLKNLEWRCDRKQVDGFPGGCQWRSGKPGAKTWVNPVAIVLVPLQDLPAGIMPSCSL